MHHKIYTMFVAFGFMEACMIACGIGYKNDEELNGIRAVGAWGF